MQATENLGGALANGKTKLLMTLLSHLKVINDSFHMFWVPLRLGAPGKLLVSFLGGLDSTINFQKRSVKDEPIMLTSVSKLLVGWARSVKSFLQEG